MHTIPKATAERHEIRPLTGIRGVAAAAVVLYHFYPAWVLLLPGLTFFGSLASRGHLGVDLFFILSGFILCYVYRAGERQLEFPEFRQFLWHRLARIFPNHIATLGAIAFLVVAANLMGMRLTGDYPPSALPFQFTMTHAWLTEAGGWNYPSWSISAEWFAYLCIFPAVWHFLRVTSGAGLSLVLGYGVLALWCFVLSPTIPPSWRAVVQVSCEFFVGAMFFRAYILADRVTRVCQRYVSAIFVVIILVWICSPSSSPLASQVLIMLFPSLLLGLTTETGLVSTLLSSSSALWLGRVSFALYMSHAIAQKVLKFAIPSERYLNAALSTRLFLLFANVVLIMAFAAALYYLIEIPSRNYMRRLGAGKPSRVPKPAVQPAH